MRQIDAANARNAKFPTVPEGISEVYVKGWNDAIDAIVDNAPTVSPDMAQVLAYESGKSSGRPHGKWIYTEYMVWQCSNCGGNPHTGTGFVPDAERMKRQWKYCNLCGADMRGGAEE